MKRFLIFLLLFPAIATVSLYVVLYLLTGAVVDSFSGPGFVYAAAIVPGLLAGLVDWLVAKTPVPAVIGTPVFAYAALVLVLVWDGSARYVFALGLIGAIPAATCSWLSSRAA